MAERFRKSWLGWIRSSEGYAVRLEGVHYLRIRMPGRELRIVAYEPFSLDPGRRMLVQTVAIPDTAEWPRAQIVDQIRRALEFDGWELQFEDGVEN